MSRPENTTGSLPAQHPLVTTATAFSVTDGEDRHPLAVQAGIPMEEALNFAFGLLAAIDHLATISIDRDPEVQDVVAIRYLASASQALVLACAASIEQGGSQ